MQQNQTNLDSEKNSFQIQSEDKLSKNSSQNSGQKFKVKSWYSNRYQIVVSQRNILFIIAFILMITMVISAIFIKYVVSSKSVEPYVIEIEEKTGIATVIDQKTSQTLTADEAVRKYFINQFINCFLGYEPKTYKSDAEIVRLMSSQKIYGQFRDLINSKQLDFNSKIEVKIKSIKFIDSSRAEIRISRNFNTKTDNGEKNEVVNMIFTMSNLSLTVEERLINPLGFQVSDFSITQEYQKPNEKP